MSKNTEIDCRACKLKRAGYEEIAYELFGASVSQPEALRRLGVGHVMRPACWVDSGRWGQCADEPDNADPVELDPLLR